MKFQKICLSHLFAWPGSYSRPTAAGASIAAPAIDGKLVSLFPGKVNISVSASCNPPSTNDVPMSACSPLPSGGISVHNVTIMYSSLMPPVRGPPKRNPRLRLRLKENVLQKSFKS